MHQHALLLLFIANAATTSNVQIIGTSARARAAAVVVDVANIQCKQWFRLPSSISNTIVVVVAVAVQWIIVGADQLMLLLMMMINGVEEQKR